MSGNRKMAELAGATEVGALGAFHLKRMWSRLMAQRANHAFPEGAPSEYMLDRTTMDLLALGIEPTMQFIFGQGPTFEQLEAWVLARNGGSIAPWRIARLNAIIGGQPDSAENAALLAAIDRAAPVLSADDLAHWEEHGYVVVRGAVSKEAAAEAEEVVWRAAGADRGNPQTWYDDSRPQGVMVQLFQDEKLEANRRSPRVHKAFAQLLGTSDLVLTTDRCGFNPPVYPGYLYRGTKLHWDAELTPPIPLGVQGVLYLAGVSARQGAFTCVPGFHKKVDAWLAALPPHRDPQRENLEALGPVPVPGQAGDLVIWHQALPHAGSPNHATLPRIAQYVTAYRARPGR